MLVVDASAVVAALVGKPADESVMDRLSADPELFAPYLLDVEVLHVLRSLVAPGELTDDRAADARVDYHDLNILRCVHQPLADRAWELRHNLSAYDAVYVALSEVLDAPLVTCDARLASTDCHRARVELFGQG
jgi:predicted nucleic acid-binding protein